MALERKVYRCLEDIVGPDYISEEPAVLDSYAHHFMGMDKLAPGGHWMPRFDAVLVPDNTKEVQAIIKACNRWKIKFKAHSTGNGAFLCIVGGGGIGIDMRRMSRILEINEKDMYAVLEPAVIGAQLQAELMKRGLTTGVIGPGGFTSAFPIVCADGGGPTTTAWGQMHRNLLGLEWVLASGEIVRTGSLGQGAGWFASEGPGPSMRGIAAGSSCTFGGVGIFTKGATKLYHWPGPPTLPVVGISPLYYLPPQSLFGAWYFNCPSLEKVAEASYQIGREEIAIAVERCPSWMIADDGSLSYADGKKNTKDVKEQERGRTSGLLVIVGADAESEFKYKEKALMQIIKDVDGQFIPYMEDPIRKSAFLSRYLRTAICARFMMAGGGGGVMGGGITPSEDSNDHCLRQAAAVGEAKKEFLKTGLMLGEEDDGDGAYGHLCEQTRASATEAGATFVNTEEGRAAAFEFGRRCLEMRADPKNKLCCWLAERRPDLTSDDEKVAPAFTKKPYYDKKLWQNELSWVRQLKRVVDPNGVADGTLYAGE